MKNFGKKIIAWLLLLAFIFAVTPKEFVHALAGHDDAVDHFADGSPAIGNHHIHCQILQLQVDPFKEADKTLLPVENIFRELNNSPLLPSNNFIPAIYLALRGPPSHS